MCENVLKQLTSIFRFLFFYNNSFMWTPMHPNYYQILILNIHEIIITTHKNTSTHRLNWMKMKTWFSYGLVKLNILRMCFPREVRAKKGQSINRFKHRGHASKLTFSSNHGVPFGWRLTFRIKQFKKEVRVFRKL